MKSEHARPQKAKIVPLRRVEGVASELSDEALVAACATGESAALGALFDRYYAAVRAFLGRMAGTDERDLDDLVQATFEVVPKSARRFRGGSAVKVWLFGIANNVARHYIRGEIRRKRATHAYADHLRDEARAAPDGSERAIARERAERLRAAVLALSPKLREAFVLVYFQGLKGAEVAEVLGIREGTVWKRLHTARARVRAAMKDVLP